MKQRQGAKTSAGKPSEGNSSSTTSSTFAISFILAGLFLVAINLFIYNQVWQYDFVNFDDDDYVFLNSKVLAGLSWDGIWWSLTTQDQANWHPLTWISYMLDAEFYGRNAGGYHATNVILHIVNSVLLFWLLFRMTAQIRQSTFVAAVFAAHPLHVESVAWISERKDVLSTFFGILSVWAYWAYTTDRQPWRYALVVFFFALGLMAKPMLVTLPFVLLLIDLWPLRRLTASSFAIKSPERAIGIPWSQLFQLAGEKAPLFVLSMISSSLTILAQQGASAVTALEALPINVRMENALVSYMTYIGKAFWPVRLAVLYPYSPPSFLMWVLALAALLVVSVLAFRAVLRFPYVTAGWFGFLGTLVPVIGIVQVGMQPMADRYTYIPLIGLSVIVAWGAPNLLKGFPHRKPTLMVLSTATVLSCAVIASRQVEFWKDSLALWGRAVDVTKNNYVAEQGLAAELGRLNRNAEAIAHLKEALRINPSFTEAHYNMGVELVALNKWDEASTHFSEAIRLNPNHASAHNNLANILFSKSKLSEAAAEYMEALRISPGYVDARSNLALVFLRQGKLDDARRELLSVLEVDPAHANAQTMLRSLDRPNE